MINLTRIQKFKAFLFSYSGLIAIVGIVMLSGQIWGYLSIPNSKAYEYLLFDKTFSPIAMSVVAAVIFYFLSFYWPNVGKSKVESLEIREYFRRLNDLNAYSMLSLGLYRTRLWHNDVFKRPDLSEIIRVSNGKVLQDAPYTDCWQEDEIYDIIQKSENWIEFFTVIVNEQLKIIERISSKINFHASVKEEILKLKGSFTLDNFLKSSRHLAALELSIEQRQKIDQLKYLVLFFCDHIETLARVEKRYYESIYGPL